MTCLRYSVLLLAACLAAGGCAARAGEAPAKTDKASAAPDTLATPRKTMSTFLNAMWEAPKNAARYADAAACLDYSKIDSPTVEDRKTLCVRLMTVLNKTWYVDLEKDLPDDPAGADFTRALEVDGKTYGRFAIARQETGEWLISAVTVAEIDRLYEAVRGLPDISADVLSTAQLDPAQWIEDTLVPASLKGTGFLLKHWQWLGLALLIFIGVILNKIAAFLAGRISGTIFKRWSAGVDPKIVAAACRPVGVLAMAALWWFGLYLLNLPIAVQSLLGKIAIFFMAFALVWTLYKVVDVLAAYLAVLASKTESKMDDLLIPLVRKSLKIFVVIFGIVFVAANLGINVMSMLVGLGIGGVAFAFAAKDTVENFFGSLTVLLDRPFSIGDWVVIDGLEGTVEEVGFRSTRIRTFYNSLVTVPNSKFVSANVDNYGARFKRRIKCHLGVTYGTPPEKIEAFCAGIRELVLRHPYTEKSYFHVYLNQFGACSLDILLYVFVVVPDWSTELRERERLFLDIMRLAKKLGVEFAFPTQTLHVESMANLGSFVPTPERPIDKASGLDAARKTGIQEAAALAAAQYGPGGEKPPPYQAAKPPENPADLAGS